MICLFCKYTPVERWAFGEDHVIAGKKRYIVSTAEHCQHEDVVDSD